MRIITRLRSMSYGYANAGKNVKLQMTDRTLMVQQWEEYKPSQEKDFGSSKARQDRGEGKTSSWE
jgi:hypothetical protein